ncbi:MAG: M15 family metallopeptidase [Bacteroidota bacterium]|nr:M15 family metallopeptidase [Bacteroidota bacterium]
MKKSEIRVMQQELKSHGLYRLTIDGLRGPGTDAAVAKLLAQRTADLPGDWGSWSGKRKAVACLQLICRDHAIDSGEIDGWYGPQTADAAEQLLALKSTGSVPRPFGDIIPLVENPHDFPPEREAALNAYYGKSCKVTLVRVPCPWTLRLDWNLAATTSSITIHTRLADSLANILAAALAHYGEDGIRAHGLDRYGGSYVCRKKRGGSSSWSTHAWGIAIDWFPSKNRLKWNSDRASLADPALDHWWELWEREGWVSLGRSENRDWMHVQAARR